MRWIAALILLLLTSAPALAQPLAVRSGEHAGFSRLVLQFPALPQWVFGQVDGGYELRTSATKTEFDISRVFLRIPRSRISEVSAPAAGRLFLRPGCPCSLDVFELRGGRIVIDVKDEAGPEGAPDFPQLPPLAQGEVWLPNTRPAPSIEPAATAQTIPPTASDNEPRKEPVEAKYGAAEETPETPPSMSAATLPGKADRPDSTFLLLLPSAEKSRKLSEIEQALLRQLSRAAAQGMIRIDTPLPEPRTIEAPQKREEDEEEAAQASPPAATEPEAQPHFNVQTASDREARKWPTNGTTTENGFACLPEALFDIASWGPADLSDGLTSPPDLAVLGEFDNPDPDKVLALVRSYLFLGFGAEAKAAMRAFDMALPEFPLLSQMADIVDEKGTTSNGPLQQQLSCATAGAMWALMARRDAPAIRAVDRKSVLRAFSALPPHLKKLLGPPLAERFLVGKDMATATTIRDIMARAPGNPGRELTLLDASLAGESGNPAEALENLQNIVRAGEGDAETMARFLQARLQAGLDVESKDIDLALSMAAELRGTENGSTLSRLAIVALLEKGEVDTALEKTRVAVETGLLPNGPAEELAARAQLRNASGSDDAEFVRLVLQYPLQDVQLSDTAANARLAVAERLAELGLVSLARGWIDPLGDSPGARLVRAGIEIADDNPAAVEPLLNGMDTPQALELRAVAREMMGDLATAARLYDSLNMTDRAESARLRSGDLSGLANSEDKTRTAAAQLLSATNSARPPAVGATSLTVSGLQDETRPQSPGDPRPTGPADPKLIESSRRLLGQSQALREAVTELLGQ